MLIAHYIGNHAADDIWSRIGWAITRKAQKGPYGHITHCEAIHAEHENGEVTIASSSLRDGGVRSKRVKLNPAHWMIVDVPQWDAEHSDDHLQITSGQPYDLRGAIATVLPGSPQAGRWFCSQWVAHPYLRAAATFGPNHFAAICLSLGRDVSAQFFAARK